MHPTKWKKQSKKAKYCRIPAILHPGKGKTMERVQRSVVVKGFGEGKIEHREF